MQIPPDVDPRQFKKRTGLTHEAIANRLGVHFGLWRAWFVKGRASATAIAFLRLKFPAIEVEIKAERAAAKAAESSRRRAA